MTDQPIQVFEQIKQLNDYGQEYWSTRQLAKILEYKKYANFQEVIGKAKESCKKSGQSIQNHFADVGKMIKLGNTASREIADIMLSRYACYLIMQNADPSKEIVARGQTYFAIQTRRQELQDELIEDQKRAYLRDDMTTHGKHLSGSAGSGRSQKLWEFYELWLYGSLWWSRHEANSCSQTTQTSGKNPRPYGQRRTSCQSFPHHSSRCQIASGKYSGRSSRKSNSF
jgi:hypothetical protein